MVDVQHVINRTVVGLSMVAILLVIASFVTRNLILGGMQVFILNPAPALTGQISQALASQTDRPTLLLAGKDYFLQNTRYFDNVWAVTTIASTSGSFDNNIVVLRKQHNIYMVVLGPGTMFPRSYAQSMPSDLMQYLNQLGAFYGVSG